MLYRPYYNSHSSNKVMSVQWSSLMFAVIILNNYYVAPSMLHPVTAWYIISNNDSPCTGSSNHNSVSHIDQYTSEQIFVDGATMQFCPGDHHVTSSLRLDNVQNLTVQGSTSTNINIHSWINIKL